MDLHDRLRHYQYTCSYKEYYVQQLQYLQAVKTEESAEDDEAIKNAKFWVGRYMTISTLLGRTWPLSGLNGIHI